MNVSQSELSYPRAAVQAATSAGLVVILYDMLINDLRQAIAAMRAGSIEDRSDRLNHAFAVLGLLEGSLDRDKEAPAAEICPGSMLICAASCLQRNSNLTNSSWNGR